MQQTTQTASSNVTSPGVFDLPPMKSRQSLGLHLAGEWRGLRVLAWDRDRLFVSRGYEVLHGRPGDGRPEWTPAGTFHPPSWRHATNSTRLGARLARDGFHALAVLPSGRLVGTVPGAIVCCDADDDRFDVTHRVTRGTRPLTLTTAPDGSICWGEYFDNAGREGVHICRSMDEGATWHTVYTFPPRAIRHVHSITYDQWGDCFWVLTGDEGSECRIICASPDWSDLVEVVAGDQQARAVACVPTADAIYFASDTPFEQNYIYRLERTGRLDRLAPVDGSVFHGCLAGGALFFSTAVEPSTVNCNRRVSVYGSPDGATWLPLLGWPKDRWSMRLFQYGVAILPAGLNTTDLLVVTTTAVERADGVATAWSVRPRGVLDAAATNPARGSA